ncbi:MAG: TonB-dependent receptor, partial [Blastocatellia bacterium]|nr:TonB-dependent receptor [Blastocatellia bacterium]
MVTLNTAQINSLVVSSGNLAGPVVDVNPTSLAVLAAAAARYPSNDITTGDGINTGGFRFNSPTPVKQNAHTARFDWILTGDQKHQISLRGNYQQDLVSTFKQFPDTPAPGTWSHPLGFAATHNWLVSNNMTNRFSFGLTRLAFSNQGDSSEPNINFRDVYNPARFVRTNSRVNPTFNITDDFTWLKGNHNIQFGTNIRLIRNKLTNFAQAFDNGSMNFGFYAASGGSVLTPVNEFLRTTTGDPNRSVGSASTRSVQSGLTALLGRLSQYTANFNFQLDGNPFPSGSPTVREWATEEYDFYVQDAWKLRPNVTITMGLRYGLSIPVYETQGFQVAPNIPLQEYFERRVAASARGENYTEPLIMDLVGPANNKPGFYALDKNNFQPRVAIAWSPNFESGFLRALFGSQNDSVIRGGFAITNDYFGQQLAVTFDAANTLGFATSRNISANTYNITTNPGPLYTGSNMAIRPLPNITTPANLVFPQQQPANNARRIETSLDTNLVAPIHYSWNLSFGRKLPKGAYFDISYIGRAARNLLATRDVMAPNNLTDPRSGQTYYEAASYVELQRRAGTPLSQLQNQPFFENLWTPGSLATAFGYAAGTSNTQAVFRAQGDFVGGNDWSSMQTELDNRSGKRLFHQNQYAALTSF